MKDILAEITELSNELLTDAIAKEVFNRLQFNVPLDQHELASCVAKCVRKYYDKPPTDVVERTIERLIQRGWIVKNGTEYGFSEKCMKWFGMNMAEALAIVKSIITDAHYPFNKWTAMFAVYDIPVKDIWDTFLQAGFKATQSLQTIKRPMGKVQKYRIEVNFDESNMMDGKQTTVLHVSLTQ